MCILSSLTISKEFIILLQTLYWYKLFCFNALFESSSCTNTVLVLLIDCCIVQSSDQKDAWQQIETKVLQNLTLCEFFWLFGLMLTKLTGTFPLSGGGVMTLF